MRTKVRTESDMVLPPVSRMELLRLELRLVPAQDRADALQEAWVAHLEGRNPAQAVNTYARRQRRRRRLTTGLA